MVTKIEITFDDGRQAQCVADRIDRAGWSTWVENGQREVVVTIDDPGEEVCRLLSVASGIVEECSNL